MSSHKLTFSLSIIILFTVASLLVPPTAEAQLTWNRKQSDLVFYKGESVSVTLPFPNQGFNAVSLSPALPTGVSFTTPLGPPELTGTPTAVKAKTLYTLTASIQGETPITQTFHITVLPGFRWASTQSDLEWTKGSRVNTALSGARGASGITYALKPDLPTGVIFLPFLGLTTIAGRPSAGMATTAYTFTASASGETAITQTFNITVHSPPEFSSSIAPSQQVATVGQRFSLVLPAATQEDGDTTTYTLTGDIPDGLTFTGSSRTLAGTPTTAAAAVTLTYTAVDGGSHSADTDATTTFTLVVNAAAPPAAPSGVVATAGVGKITVTWANGSTSGFEYSKDSGAWAAVATYPLELTGSAGTPISVRIRVARSGNTPAGTPSAAVSGTPTAPPAPAAPTGVSVVSGVGKITVTWSNGSTSGFEYSRDGGAWTAVGTYPLELTGTAGTEISVRIRVARSGNTPAGTPSAAQRGTPTPPPAPAAPTGVSVVSGVGKVTVTWDSGSTSGFEYSRDGGAWTAVGTYPLELTGTAGTEISVRIRVARSGNTPAGTPSAAQRGTPTATPQQPPRQTPAPPAAPTGVSVAAGVGKITVTWTGGSSTGYEYSRDSGAWTAVATYPLELTGPNGTPISVRIRVAAVGNVPAGTASAAVTGTPTATSQQPPPQTPAPPAAPTGVSVAAGVGKVTVTWDSGSTSGFEYSRDGGAWTAVGTYPLELTGTAGTEISVRIRVARSGNTPAGTPSAAQRGTPVPDPIVPTDPTVPAAPTNLRAGPGPGSITVAWDEGRTGYEYSTDAGTTWTDVTAHPLEIPGTPGTTITVQVRKKMVGDIPAGAIGTTSAQVGRVGGTAPVFTGLISPMSLTAGVAMQVMTLPMATPANIGDTLTYRISPALPTGLAFTPGTRVLSGTPAAVMDAKQYTYTVADQTGATAVLIFTITVGAPPVAPTLPELANKAFRAGTAVREILPMATSGTGVTYTLAPAAWNGLVFTAGTRLLSGTPTAAMDATQFTYTATNSAGSVSQTFSITVNPPVPDVPVLPAVPAQTYTVGTAVREILPAVTSGTGVTYTLTGVLPAGLLFDAATRLLSGTPTAVIDATQFTYTATNSAGSVSQPFTITIVEPPPRPLVIPSKGFAVFVHVGATGTDTGISDAVKTIAVTPNKVMSNRGMPDLWDFFHNEGTIMVRGPAGAAVGALKITEVMAAKDAYLGARSKYCQWIEVYNRTGADIDFRDAGWMFDFTQGGVFPLPAVATATDAGRVDLVSNMGNPGYWDIKSTGGRTEAASTVAAVPLVSMYRKLKQFDEDNTGHAEHATDDGDPERAGTWVASVRPSRNLSGNRLGTPGTYPEPVLPPKTVLSQEVLINEIGNSSSDAKDWVELLNTTGGEVNLRKWELNIVMSVDGVAKETQLVSFPDTDSTKLPAGGILLLANSDPTGSGNDLAAGVQINKAAADRVQRGVQSLYYVDSNLVLPNSGKYNLILRTANDKEGQPSHIVDHGGTYFSEKKEGPFDTEVWPLQLWAAGHSNVIEGAEEDFRSGLVYKRNGKNTGIGEKHWAKVGFTGIGYDRTAAKTDENGGTPGYANDALKEKVADLSDAEVAISEIMFATGSGRRSLPQWIELYNSSLTQGVNLNGWQLEIQNARDENLDARQNATITLGAVTLAPNQTVLIVSTSGSNSGRDHFPDTRTIDLWTSHRSELDMEARTDTVLSATGFYLKLTDKDKKVVDEVGNTDGNRRTNDTPAWALPMGINSDGHRASIIRRYEDDMAADGMMLSGWISAQNTGRSAEGYSETTYYGDRNDVGTPGHHGGGPLPVSLASFRPARDTATGQVVIHWTTESELNNAGFNILRSETKTGTFTVVNSKGIIPGHGTTAEKHVYTWTDASAKPNVVYYYQIEDVSLDGTRTTLRTTHLRGNVNAAGKLTTTWGDVKTQE